MAVHIIDERFLWPNSTIPYLINTSDFPESSAAYNEVVAAINLFNRLTNLAWIPRTNETDYVEFTIADSWCRSFIGRQGGRQTIECALHRNFRSGNLVHEMLHAVGFYHEHQRSDRDNYIEVDYNNVISTFDFEKLSARDTRNATDYDPGSIMHYPARVTNPNLIRNPQIDTIRLKAGFDYAAILGQRGSLSLKDIEGVNKLYAKSNMNKIKLNQTVTGEIAFLYGIVIVILVWGIVRIFKR